MGTFDQLIKTTTSSFIILNPFHYTLPAMKFVFPLVALALIAASDAAPAQEVTANLEGNAEAFSAEGASSFFTGGLDGIQGALEDIKSAGLVLDALEGQLSTLAAASGDVNAAEGAIETAVASAGITNTFTT